jgi:hypothetical protein
MCTDIQPQNLKELVEGVKLSWRTQVNIAYYNKNINHLKKVLTKVINVTGRATGF